MVIDTTENIDKLLRSNASLGETFIEYFLPMSAYFANLLSPFLVFLAVIWVTSQLAQKTEIISILSGGVSFQRMLLPFMIGCFGVTLLVLVSSHFLVPITNRIKYEFEREHLNKRTYFDHNNHRELSKDKHYYFRSIDELNQVGRDLAIEDWNDGKLTHKLMAEKAVFDTTTNMWTLTNITERAFFADGLETLKYTARRDTSMDVRYSDFGQRDEVVMNMKTSELNEFLRTEIEKGSSKTKLIEIEKYMRTANAFSIMVLGFIAVATASRKSRRGLGVHLLAAIIIGLIFLFTSRVSSVSVTNAGVPAYIATWVPNVAFFLVGIFIYRRTPK